MEDLPQEAVGEDGLRIPLTPLAPLLSEQQKAAVAAQMHLAPLLSEQ